jgi:phage terminase small subunit
MTDKLTPKQKSFIDNYILTGNATQAAISAGYPSKSARAIGAENLTKPYIHAYYEKRLEALDLQTMMQQKEVLQRLTRIARREEKETVVITTKSRTSSYDDTGKKVIVESETPLLVEIPTKIQDTNKSLELLGKHHRLFVDRVENDTTIEVTKTLASLLDELRDDPDEAK